MDIDPHTIQQILMHVRDQLRCPQCRKRVSVTLESLRVLGETFAVMQLRCSICSAHLMLHATLRSLCPRNGPRPGGAGHAFSVNAVTLSSTGPRGGRSGQKGKIMAPGSQKGKNASTALQADPEEMKKLKKELRDAGGSFMELFGDNR